MRQSRRFVHISTPVVLLGVVLLGVACAEPENPIDKLPELPAELAATLERDPGAPVLRTRLVSPQPPAPPRPPQQPQAVPVPSSCTTKYLTQAIYPVVVCHPPNELTEGVLVQDTTGRSSSPAARHEDVGELARVEKAIEPRFFKLGSHRGERLFEAYFCREYGGPWSATAERTTSCIFGADARWILEVPTAGLQLVWYGEWEDIPDYPDLYVVQGDLYQLGDEACSCCGGYQYCGFTQSCIDQTIECRPPGPQ